MPRSYDPHEDRTGTTRSTSTNRSSASTTNPQPQNLFSDFFSTLFNLGQSAGLLPHSFLCGTIPTSYSAKKPEEYFHNKDVWFSDGARKKGVRRKFWSGSTRENPEGVAYSLTLNDGLLTKGRYPYKPHMGRSAPLCFGYSACGHDQVAVEADVVLAEGLVLSEADKSAVAKETGEGWDKGGPLSIEDRGDYTSPRETPISLGASILGSLGLTPRVSTTNSDKASSSSTAEKSDHKPVLVKQGVLAHCLSRLLTRHRHDASWKQSLTHADLAGFLALEMEDFKVQNRLPELDQTLLFTVSSAVCCPERMRVFYMQFLVSCVVWEWNSRGFEEGSRQRAMEFYPMSTSACGDGRECDIASFVVTENVPTAAIPTTYLRPCGSRIWFRFPQKPYQLPGGPRNYPAGRRGRRGATKCSPRMRVTCRRRASSKCRQYVRAQ